jgi:hypothetical protein
MDQITEARDVGNSGQLVRPASGCGVAPGIGRSSTRKSQAMSSAPTAKTTSPGSRIHYQNRVFE